MFGIIGLGFVGNAIFDSFKDMNIKSKGYDIKPDSPNTFDEVLDTEFLFLCLPSPFDENSKKGYDISIIEKTLQKISEKNYLGLVIIKSTVSPGTCKKFSETFQKLNIVHNPEFLKARRAKLDFLNQEIVILGKTTNCDLELLKKLKKFYINHFPNSEITSSTSCESESMKCFVNAFHSTKSQFFTEIYLLCEKLGINYDNVRELMLKSTVCKIDPNYTRMPGPDGKLSFGGHCLTKDIKALISFMSFHDVPKNVFEATLHRRNEMRK